MLLQTLVCVSSLAAASAQLVGPGDLNGALEGPGGPDEDAPPPPLADPDPDPVPPPPPDDAPDVAADDVEPAPDAPPDDAPLDPADVDPPPPPPEVAADDAPDDVPDEAPADPDAPPPPQPDIEDAPLDPDEPPPEPEQAFRAAPVDDDDEDDVELEQTSLPIIPRATLVPACGCANRKKSFEPKVSDIRDLSNKFLKSKNTKSPVYSNMLWSWGQFLDHDFVASSDDPDDDKEFVIDVEGTPMKLQRVRHVFGGKCRRPQSVVTPNIDGGPIYSNFEPYVQDTLRKPGTCMLRTSAGDLPPVTTKPVTTTGEDGQPVTKHFFLAGDSRVNEHSILTNMHIIWLREHNRLCGVVDGDSKYDDLDADKKFDLVRDVIIAKMQEITLFEWLPALGISPEDVYFWRPLFRVRRTAALSTEFFLNYRWGHLGVPVNVGRWQIIEIFDGEEFMNVEGPEGSATPGPTNDKLEELLSATANEAMSDLDGRMEESLRSNLFVPGMDLGARNIFRGREVGVVGYRRLAFCYRSFPDFVRGHDDPFIGATAERPLFPGMAFGRTLNNIMLDQFHRVFFGREGNWWEFEANKVRGFRDEIIGTKLSDIIRANTKAQVKDDVFFVSGGEARPMQTLSTSGAGKAKKRGKAKPSDPSFRPTKKGRGGKFFG